MTQYLVAIHHPDDYDPTVAEDEAMHRDIAALNAEMKAAGGQDFRWRPAAGKQREVDPSEARRERARHRRALHGGQGAHWRFLGAGSR